MQEEKKPESNSDSSEIADVITVYFDGKYMATVFYKGEVFGIKEASEYQLLESIKIAIEKRDEDDLLRSTRNNQQD